MSEEQSDIAKELDAVRRKGQVEFLADLLEQECPECHGAIVARHEKESWCSACHGCGKRGKVLTAAGEYLMELLSAHLERFTENDYGGNYTSWSGSLRPAVKEVFRDMIH